VSPTASRSSTARYVALLRAINVGGRTVKMDVLREIFASLGFTTVETFIASGNAIFDAPGRVTETRLVKQIEDALQAALGFEVITFLRTPAELAAIAAYEPFPSSAIAGAKGLYVGFLHVAPGADAAAKLLALRSPTDDFRVHGRELYWLASEGMGLSKISTAALERLLGARTTTRNVTTVRKLAAKYPVMH
jgi:uncharacterized protein (DUF1697 family)